MTGRDERVQRAVALREEGRYAEALAALHEALDAADTPARIPVFIVMLEWQFLAEAYPPAREALRAARDAQAARLLAGDVAIGGRPRFALVEDMNRILDDVRSTYELFARLDAERPDVASRHARAALPAVVAAGDLALADRYRGEPLDLLDTVNASATVFPLVPPAGEAPRLAAELSLLVGDVRIAMDVLRARGRDADAAQLRERLLDGLVSEPLRALARRELDGEGTIMHEVAAQRMFR
jgi:hypothetical protein